MTIALQAAATAATAADTATTQKLTAGNGRQWEERVGGAVGEGGKVGNFVLHVSQSVSPKDDISKNSI